MPHTDIKELVRRVVLRTIISIDDSITLIKPKIRKKLYDIFLRNKINSTSSRVSVDKVILNHKKEIDELDPDFIEFYKNLKLVY